MNYDKLSFAKMFATQHHVLNNHQMYGCLPYTHHLEAVAKILAEYGPVRGIADMSIAVEDMLCAAWLHDVVEDTDVKVRDIREMFGNTVAMLVEAVTSEPGENRKVRNALTYPKTLAAGPAAVRLKLADRFANVSNGGASVSMYVKEHEAFRHGLRTIGQNEDLWGALDIAINSAQDAVK